MKVVRVNVRLALVLCFVYIGLMVALYHYLTNRRTLSQEEFASDLRTKVRSASRHDDEEKKSENLGIVSFADQSIGAVTPNQKRSSDTIDLATKTVSVLANESVDVRPSTQTPNYCLHAFYYMWYGNVTFDGQYYHWNHNYLPHWQSSVTNRFPKGRHKPPDDIGASFYPLLGPYSSSDPVVMAHHVQQAKRAGVGVLAVSWYPPAKSDDEGTPMAPLMPELLDICHEHSVKVAIHAEPYAGRTPETFAQDLVYIYERYYHHPALLKVQKGDRQLPLVYVYDSYLSSAEDWLEVLSAGGQYSIRGKEYDCVAISLLVSKEHKMFVQSAGFDGFYTYFVSEGFSYGSRTRVWEELSKFSEENGLLFIPSAGPGYDDTQVRPWNAKNRKTRDDGRYYTSMMTAAFQHNVGNMVSITSFNEWHEGTQIEPAIPKTVASSSKNRYLDYRPRDPWFYIDLTANLSAQFTCNLMIK